LLSYTASEIKYLPANHNVLNFVALLFHVLPKNFISYLVGTIVRITWPGPLRLIVVKGFASLFRIDLAEAEYPIGDYKTIEDLFIRRLRAGVRPVADTPVVSPADGYLARSLPIAKGMLLQAKGIEYGVDEMVTGSRRESAGVEWGWFQTVYLAPHNYHRVHAPFSGRLISIKHIPGQLWPVNVPFVLRIFRLFSRNERLVFEFELEKGKAWVSMIGALNVGRMESPFWPGYVTNALERQLGAEIAVRSFQQPIHISKGDELGTFMLGSTVVITYDRPAMSGLRFKEYYGDRPVRMGESLSE
jgi:phosphatidylserine decarboxylase